MHARQLGLDAAHAANIHLLPVQTPHDSGIFRRRLSRTYQTKAVNTKSEGGIGRLRGAFHTIAASRPRQWEHDAALSVTHGTTALKPSCRRSLFRACHGLGSTSASASLSAIDRLERYTLGYVGLRKKRTSSRGMRHGAICNHVVALHQGPHRHLCSCCLRLFPMQVLSLLQRLVAPRRWSSIG